MNYIIGERLRDIKVTFLKNDKTFNLRGYYSKPYFYRFNHNGNLLTWKTNKKVDLESGAEYVLSGTVEAIEDFCGETFIYLNRCIIK